LTSLGTLAAGVAHEINNPLAYVLLNLGYVSEELPKLIADSASSADRVGSRSNPGADDRLREVRVALDHARNGAERIRDIVRGLKTFSRPENETLAPLDVVQVLEATLAMISNEIRHRARVVKDYSQAPEVVANEARLGQVFLNLLLNAVQALPEGRSEANEIRIVVHASAPDSIVVEVHDNGVGIAPQVRGRIFEPFFTTKPVGIGTGLGLAICHGIVTSLGGTLSVDSELGKGSVFRVELPAAGHTIGVVTVGRANDIIPPAIAAPTRRILVVDDEPIVCFSLQRLLSSEGEVVALTSAREAMARFEAGDRFSIILCDLLMPEMDGPALYDQIKKVAPDQADRMVFVTGGAFTMRARDFLTRVQNARLSKPFDVDALFNLVRARMA
jgi:CheY-like chemotaxis protein